MVALLQSFGLAYDVTSQGEDERMLVPWFLPEKCNKWKKYSTDTRMEVSFILA